MFVVAVGWASLETGPYSTVVGGVRSTFYHFVMGHSLALVKATTGAVVTVLLPFSNIRTRYAKPVQSNNEMIDPCRPMLYSNFTSYWLLVS